MQTDERSTEVQYKKYMSKENKTKTLQQSKRLQI